MMTQRQLQGLRISNGDGIQRPLPAHLADFNVLAIRRVPVASHGPATPLLRRLLADSRGARDATVRGFDIRSPDRPCETCHGPSIVFNGPELATICDSDGSILQHFGVVGYDRFFVVRSGPQVFDAGSLEEISRSGLQLRLDGASARQRDARAPPNCRRTEVPRRILDGRSEPYRASN